MKLHLKAITAIVLGSVVYSTSALAAYGPAPAPAVHKPCPWSISVGYGQTFGHDKATATAKTYATVDGYVVNAVIPDGDADLTDGTLGLIKTDGAEVAVKWDATNEDFVLLTNSDDINVLAGTTDGTVVADPTGATVTVVTTQDSDGNDVHTATWALTTDETATDGSKFTAPDTMVASGTDNAEANSIAVSSSGTSDISGIYTVDDSGELQYADGLAEVSESETASLEVKDIKLYEADVFHCSGFGAVFMGSAKDAKIMSGSDELGKYSFTAMMLGYRKAFGNNMTVRVAVGTANQKYNFTATGAGEYKLDSKLAANVEGKYNFKLGKSFNAFVAAGYLHLKEADAQDVQHTASSSTLLTFKNDPSAGYAKVGLTFSM